MTHRIDHAVPSPIVRPPRSPARRRAVVALVASGSVALLTGVAAAQSPGRVVPPVVFTIEVRWPGASAADLAARVATPIERALHTLDGLRAMHSQSEQGRTAVTVDFDTPEAPDRTAARIEQTLAALRPPLPDAASRPTVAWSRDRARPR